MTKLNAIALALVMLVSTSQAWQGTQKRPPLQDIPDSELKKLSGDCQIHNYGGMSCSVYNGSDDWTFVVITISITVYDKKGGEVLSRRYNFVTTLPPLSNGTLYENIGFSLEKHQTFKFWFVAAKGEHS